MWKKNNGRRVIVGMSGGVDSAVAAALLLEAGYEVVGLFMKNWEEDDAPEYCAAEKDLADAREVCETLEIQLETANFSHEYWENVFVHFLREYKVGRTPNPDILCNREIKFKTFMDWAISLGADYIATGHYAQTGLLENRLSLRKGADPEKDQTYFLYTLGQKELKKTLFPIGHLLKFHVRAKAADLGLSIQGKKDSTGICFIGERRFRDFLNQYLSTQKGNIKTLEGKTIGTHSGAMYYTIGQRGGLGIGGMDNKNDTGEAWFVASKDVEKNLLYVVQGHDHPALHKRIVITETPTWVSARPPILPLYCTAKTRYRQADQACLLTAYSNTHTQVEFVHSQRAIAPGQSLVFYKNEHCLGGGVIQQGLNA
jgi:tRNA-specific 2-thiouridylase